jgi:hypothetical protein
LIYRRSRTPLPPTNNLSLSLSHYMTATKSTRSPVPHTLLVSIPQRSTAHSSHSCAWWRQRRRM